MKKNTWLLYVFAFVCMIAICNLVLFDWYQVPSNSMAPTLANDCILLTKRNTRAVCRQDIVVFRKPEWNPAKADTKVYVKRCIAGPGDTVNIQHPRTQRIVQAIPGQQSVMYSFPQDTLFKNWTLTNYGPFRVPKKGMRISLNDYNRRLYHKLIEFENRSGTVTRLDGEFIFQHDYYFMVGDNFLMSEDSRAWGCVPDDHLLGKVLWHS